MSKETLMRKLDYSTFGTTSVVGYYTEVVTRYLRRYYSNYVFTEVMEFRDTIAAITHRFPQLFHNTKKAINSNFYMPYLLTGVQFKGKYFEVDESRLPILKQLNKSTKALIKAGTNNEKQQNKYNS